MNKKMILSLLLMTGTSAYGMNTPTRYRSPNPTEAYFHVLLREQNKKTEAQLQPSAEKNKKPDGEKEEIKLPPLFVVQKSKL